MDGGHWLYIIFVFLGMVNVFWEQPNGDGCSFFLCPYVIFNI